MAKRIRHLEFYGYTDQNAYNGMCNPDLSLINEVNKEQDKVISDLSGQTIDKVDIDTFNVLSGKVDTYISAQTDINIAFDKAISANTERITALEEKDKEVISGINEVIGDVNSINSKLDELSAKTDSIDSALNEHIEEWSEFKGDVNVSLSSITDAIDTKLDKSDAEDTYAKKSDLDNYYTKNEIDDKCNEINDKLSGYATVELVKSIECLDKETADGYYASNESVNDLESKISELNEKYSEEISGINNDLQSLETKHDGDINSLKASNESLASRVSTNENDIEALKNTKADKSDLDYISGSVSSLNSEVQKKVDRTDFIDFKTTAENTINSLIENQFDESKFNTLSGTVDDLSSALNKEIEDRISGDSSIVSLINEENELIKNSISSLTDSLNAEITNRENADNAIIGNESDSYSDITVYGAKAYADHAVQNVLSNANLYTDNKISELSTYVDNQDSLLEQKITAKADKEYIDKLKNELQTDFNSKLETEKNLRENGDDDLSNALSSEIGYRISADTKIISSVTHTSNVVHAITDWDGDDRESYTDTGNGILDVLHREFHDLELHVGYISNETLEKKNMNEIAFGNYNVSNTSENPSGCTIFSIGNGVSNEERSNAIELRKNGDLYLWIEGEFMCINDLLSMLAHETYN